MSENEKEMTTYLCERTDHSKFKITVPSDWKVTFGPVAVRKGPQAPGSPRMPLALRFYSNKEQQRAIFTDVIGFRDMSLDIREEEVDVQEKHGFTEVDGIRQNTTFSVKTKKWVDPDDEEGNKKDLSIPYVHSQPYEREPMPTPNPTHATAMPLDPEEA